MHRRMLSHGRSMRDAPHDHNHIGMIMQMHMKGMPAHVDLDVDSEILPGRRLNSNFNMYICAIAVSIYRSICKSGASSLWQKFELILLQNGRFQSCMPSLCCSCCGKLRECSGSSAWTACAVTIDCACRCQRRCWTPPCVGTRGSFVRATRSICQ